MPVHVPMEKHCTPNIYKNVRTCACMHGYKGHKPWHTVYLQKWLNNNYLALLFYFSDTLCICDARANVNFIIVLREALLNETVKCISFLWLQFESFNSRQKRNWGKKFALILPNFVITHFTIFTVKRRFV